MVRRGIHHGARCAPCTARDPRPRIHLTVELPIAGARESRHRNVVIAAIDGCIPERRGASNSMCLALLREQIHGAAQDAGKGNPDGRGGRGWRIDAAAGRLLQLKCRLRRSTHGAHHELRAFGIVPRRDCVPFREMNPTCAALISRTFFRVWIVQAMFNCRRHASCTFQFVLPQRSFNGDIHE